MVYSVRSGMVKVKLIYKGGTGSGNFGHVGRPGKVGGSAGGSGGFAGNADLDPSNAEFPAAIDQIEGLATLAELHAERGFVRHVPIDDARYFDKVTRPDRRMPYGQCFHNSVAAYNERDDLRLCVGIAWQKSEIDSMQSFDSAKYWEPAPGGCVHAWNITRDGKVLDRTYGNDKTVYYTGFVLSAEVAKSFPVVSFEHDNGLGSYAWNLVESLKPSGATGATQQATYDAWYEAKQ